MASFVVALLLAFLATTSLLQAEARESQFFSKTVRYVSPQEPSSVSQETPKAMTMEEELVAFAPQSQNGYGLYARLPDRPQLPATIGNNYYTGSLPSRFPNNSEREANAEYNNNNEDDNAEYNNNNKYDDSRYNSNNNNNKDDDARYNSNNNNNKDDDARYNNNNNNNNNKDDDARYYNNNNNEEEKNVQYTAGDKNGNPNSKAQGYGMSDTRYQENGRYFYDLNSGRSFSSRYGPRNIDGNYYGSGGSSNNGGKDNRSEYNYETNGFQENPDEYVP